MFLGFRSQNSIRSTKKSSMAAAEAASSNTECSGCPCWRRLGGGRGESPLSADAHRTNASTSSLAASPLSMLRHGDGAGDQIVGCARPAPVEVEGCGRGAPVSPPQWSTGSDAPPPPMWSNHPGPHPGPHPGSRRGEDAGDHAAESCDGESSRRSPETELSMDPAASAPSRWLTRSGSGGPPLPLWSNQPPGVGGGVGGG